MEAKRYAELVSRLQTLNTQRLELEGRVSRLRRMKDVLSPFSAAPDARTEQAADVENPVQPNLVVRDGELERELERMRTLLVRVGARVAQVREAGSGGFERAENAADAMDIDLDVEGKRQVDALLQGF
jgi:hypothetical protein